MLEFLKEVNENKIYERAVDVENKLVSFDAVSPMATYLEVLFKTLYVEFYGANDNIAKRGNIHSLITNQDFLQKLADNVGITEADIKYVKTHILKPADDFSHNLNPKNISADDMEKCFKRLYKISGAYYKYKTGKVVPAWSNEKYNRLLSKVLGVKPLRNKAEVTPASKMEEQKPIEKDSKKTSIPSSKISEANNKEIANSEKDLKKLTIEDVFDDNFEVSDPINDIRIRNRDNNIAIEDTEIKTMDNTNNNIEITPISRKREANSDFNIEAIQKSSKEQRGEEILQDIMQKFDDIEASVKNNGRSSLKSGNASIILTQEDNKAEKEAKIRELFGDSSKDSVDSKPSKSNSGFGISKNANTERRTLDDEKDRFADSTSFDWDKADVTNQDIGSIKKQIRSARPRRYWCIFALLSLLLFIGIVVHMQGNDSYKQILLACGGFTCLISLVGFIFNIVENTKNLHNIDYKKNFIPAVLCAIILIISGKVMLDNGKLVVPNIIENCFSVIYGAEQDEPVVELVPAESYSLKNDIQDIYSGKEFTIEWNVEPEGAVLPDFTYFYDEALFEHIDGNTFKSTGHGSKMGIDIFLGKDYVDTAWFSVKE